MKRYKQHEDGPEDFAMQHDPDGEWEREVMRANAEYSRDYRDRLSFGQAFCAAVFVLASAVFVYHAARFFLS